MKKIVNFTDLIVWQKAHSLVVQIYTLTRTLPREELYSLSDQMRRCSVSITSNIAEGFGRFSYKERVVFFYHAQGSLTELKNQLYIAKDVGYISGNSMIDLLHKSDIVHQLLNGLIKKTKSFTQSSKLKPHSSL